MDFDSFNQRDTQPYPAPQPALLALYEHDFALRQQMREGSVVAFPVRASGDFVITGDTEGEAHRVADANRKRGDVMRDSHGNFTRYHIGPAGGESEVVVNYADASANPAVVGRIEVTRPDKNAIVFERQRDSTDADAQFIYTEKRGGVQSDLLYGSMDVAKDGRINLYFDFERKRKAMSINPTTGGEEYF